MLSTLVSSGVSATLAAYAAKEYQEQRFAEMLNFFNAHANESDLKPKFMEKFGESATSFLDSMMRFHNNKTDDDDTGARIDKINLFALNAGLNKLTSAVLNRRTYTTMWSSPQDFEQFVRKELLAQLLREHRPQKIGASIVIGGLPQTHSPEDYINFLFLAIKKCELNKDSL